MPPILARAGREWKTSAAQTLLSEHCRRIPTVGTYALDVLTGNIPAGRLVFLAVAAPPERGSRK
jgi:hypothetical protein